MSFSRCQARLLAVLVGLCLMTTPIAGQSASSTITGLVVDTSSAIVPDAKVTITNQATGVKVETQANSQGVYTMTGLPSGTYEVTIAKEGMTKFTEKDIFVGPAVVRIVNATLNVSAVSTVVTVEAAPTQVQLTTSSVSNYVAGRQVEELPLNGRNYQGLSALMPGVLNTAVGRSLGQGGFNTANAMSINGMGTSGTLYLLDGIWNMNTGNMTQTTILPNPDSIQEVRTLQNNIGPKYALLGASIVLAQTRSGTAEFHGALWEYVRNDAFDARNFFSPSVLPLKQNIFGGTLGGPLFIPKLYSRSNSKTFFFFSEQATRKTIASTIFGATPTQEMRNGIFNNRIVDPTTGQPFPQNAAGQYVIPQNRINSGSLTYLNAIAQLPNYQGSGFLNFLNSNPERLSQNDAQVKVDHNIGEKIRLMGEYFDSRQTDDLPSQTWLASPFTTNTQGFFTRNKLAQAQATAIFSPTMVNQLTIGANVYVVDLEVRGLVYKEQLPNFQYTLPYNGFLSNRLPQVDFTRGWTSLGVVQSLPLKHASDLESTLTDDWSWVRGKHTIEAGLNIVLSTKRQNIFTQSNGRWLFSGKFSGDPIADYLLGLADTFTQVSSEKRPYIHGTMVSPYVQDTYHATNKLTLNYGGRMLYAPLPAAQPGYASSFDPNKWSLAKAPIVNRTEPLRSLQTTIR